MFASYVGFSGAGPGVGVGAGAGSWDCRISRSLGASNPAYVYTFPWQALLEQNEVLLVPPASSVVWQAEHELSMAALCRLIQFGLR